MYNNSLLLKSQNGLPHPSLMISKSNEHRLAYYELEEFSKR